jgi:hypothetical protein
VAIQTTKAATKDQIHGLRDREARMFMIASLDFQGH